MYPVIYPVVAARGHHLIITVQDPYKGEEVKVDGTQRFPVEDNLNIAARLERARGLVSDQFKGSCIGDADIEPVGRIDNRRDISRIDGQAPAQGPTIAVDN